MMTICDVFDKRRLEHFHFRQTLRGGNLRLRFTTDYVVDCYDQRSFTCGKVNLSGEMPENVRRNTSSLWKGDKAMLFSCGFECFFALRSMSEPVNSPPYQNLH